MEIMEATKVKHIVEMLSSHLDSIEKVGGKMNFPKGEIEDIVNIVMKVSKIPLLRDRVLEKFNNSSGVERWITENIYSVLIDIARGAFGRIYQGGGEWNPGSDLSGIYWAVFGKETCSDNPIISNLYVALEILLWERRGEKTVSEVMHELEKQTASY